MPVNAVVFVDGDVLYSENLNANFAESVNITGDSMTGPLAIMGVDIGSGLAQAAANANAAFLIANSASVLAQGAYNIANSSGSVVAQSAYIQANAATNSATAAFANANGAFAQANIAASNTVILQGIEVTQNTNISTLNVFAYSAYAEANAAYVLANSAYNLANVVSSNAGYILANAAFAEVNSFQSIINSAFTQANTSSLATANTIILQGIEVTQNANITAINNYSISAYAVANNALLQVISAYAEANLVWVYANNILNVANASFAESNSFQSIINSAFSLANTGTVLAQAAFNTANSGNVASANTIILQGIVSTQNTRIQAINNFANSAYAKANSASSGTTAYPYNVKVYGALGNGLTNDTTAVTSAINALTTAGGGCLFFPDGNYPINMGSLPVIPSNSTVTGVGYSSIISWQGSGAYGFDFSNPSGGPTTTNSHQTIKELQFSGGSGGPAVRAYYVVDFRMTGMYMSYCTGGAIAAAQMWDSRIHDCQIIGCSGNTSTTAMLFNSGITASGFGSTTDNSNEVFITDVQIEVFTGSALVVQSGLSGSGINNFYIARVKIENENMTGTTMCTISGINHSVRDLYLAADSFQSGFSTPSVMLASSGGPNYFSNIMIFCNSSSLVTNAWVDNAGPGPSVIDTINATGSFGGAILDITGVQPIIKTGVVDWTTGLTPYAGAPTSAPGSGVYYTGTFIRNIGGANMSNISGWLCTASGNPGSWRALS